MLNSEISEFNNVLILHSKFILVHQATLDKLRKKYLSLTYSVFSNIFSLSSPRNLDLARQKKGGEMTRKIMVPDELGTSHYFPENHASEFAGTTQYTPLTRETLQSTVGQTEQLHTSS